MNSFLWYLSWVPLVTILYLYQSFLSVKNNLQGGKWFWIYFAVSLITPWILVSRFSKDIVFDAFIFDTILVLSYSIGLLYFTNSLSKFGYNQWIGIGMILAGMLFFKRGI